MKIVSHDVRTLESNSVERYLRAWRSLRVHGRRGRVKALGLIGLALVVAGVVYFFGR